jgi:hypothetical protein
MIKPICYSCRKELKQAGAILLSPPSNYCAFSEEKLSILDSVFKFHLCKDCYNLVFEFINQYGNTTKRTIKYK